MGLNRNTVRHCLYWLKSLIVSQCFLNRTCINEHKKHRKNFIPSESYVIIYLRLTNETAEDTLRQEETLWFAVCVTECIVIFVINAVTITAFARNHHTQAHLLRT